MLRENVLYNFIIYVKLHRVNFRVLLFNYHSLRTLKFSLSFHSYHISMSMCATVVHQSVLQV